MPPSRVKMNGPVSARRRHDGGSSRTSALRPFAAVPLSRSGYLVADSVVEHKTKTAHTAPETGEKFYFAVRNGLFLLRSSSFDWKEKITHTMVVAEQIRRFLIHERFGLRGWRVLFRGLWHGLTRPVQ